MKYLLVLALVVSCSSSVKHKDKETEASIALDPIVVEPIKDDKDYKHEGYKDFKDKDRKDTECQKKLDEKDVDLAKKDADLIQCQLELDKCKDDLKEARKPKKRMFSW